MDDSTLSSQDSEPCYEYDDILSETSSPEIEEDAGPSYNGILVEQAQALGKEFNNDPSVLSEEQRRALFEKYWRSWCQDLGLKSPSYYEGKSQCLSVAESAWPGAVAYLKAESMKQGYVEPEELFARLRLLKPEENYERHKFRYPFMNWDSPRPLDEECIETQPPKPEWLAKQIYALRPLSMSQELTDRYYREIIDQRDEWEGGVELMPLPNLHLLTNMSHSPGGTGFPWYLTQGLVALRNQGNDQGTKCYHEANDQALKKREAAINSWKERNPDSMLANDPLSIYKTWPADLNAKLDEIEREAIQKGRRNHVSVLQDTEKQMQTLVSFWRDGRLINGQRDPPSSWWQDPKLKAKRLLEPQFLTDRLATISKKFGAFSETGRKLILFERLVWIESIISGEPASPEALPQSLVAELELIWQDRDLLLEDDMEDEMIARVRHWRRSDRRKSVEPEISRSLQRPNVGLEGSSQPVEWSTNRCQGPPRMDHASCASLKTEDAIRLGTNLGRGTRSRAQKKLTVPEQRSVWQGRPRPRAKSTTAERQTVPGESHRPKRSAQSISREKQEVVQQFSGKPKGILKQRGKKANLRSRQLVAKDPTPTSNPQIASTFSKPKKSSSLQGERRLAPARRPGAKDTKDAKRRRPLQTNNAHRKGIQKSHNGTRQSPRHIMQRISG